MIDELSPPWTEVAPPVTEESAAGLVTWAAALAHADGEVRERERKGIRSLAERAELSPERVEALAATSLNGDALPEPRDAREARAWLRRLTELALEDGGLSSAERRFLRRAATHLGLDRHALERAIRATRRSLYRESRVARKTARA